MWSPWGDRMTRPAARRLLADEVRQRRLVELPPGAARFGSLLQFRVGDRGPERAPREHAGPTRGILRAHIEVRLGDALVARRCAVVGAATRAFLADLAREVEVLGPDLQLGGRNLGMRGAEVVQERGAEC